MEITPLTYQIFLKKCVIGLIMFEKAVKKTNLLFTIETVHKSVFALVHPGEEQSLEV